MKKAAGVFDSGYRNEWLVPISNTNNKPIIITKEKNEANLEALSDDYIVYPYGKAIAQALKHRAYKNRYGVIPYDELLTIKSERGLGKLGDSGK